jgi:hypothetical protein
MIPGLGRVSFNQPPMYKKIELWGWEAPRTLTFYLCNNML